MVATPSVPPNYTKSLRSAFDDIGSGARPLNALLRLLAYDDRPDDIQLGHVASMTEIDVSDLRGNGAKGSRIVKDVLETNGLAFREENVGFARDVPVDYVLAGSCQRPGAVSLSHSRRIVRACFPDQDVRLVTWGQLMDLPDDYVRTACESAGVDEYRREEFVNVLHDMAALPTPADLESPQRPERQDLRQMRAATLPTYKVAAALNGGAMIVVDIPEVVGSATDVRVTARVETISGESLETLSLVGGEYLQLAGRPMRRFLSTKFPDVAPDHVAVTAVEWNDFDLGPVRHTPGTRGAASSHTVAGWETSPVVLAREATRQL